MSPATRYARARDGAHIAFQTVGDGPLDLVYCPPPLSHVALGWDDPARAHALRRLASFSRLILFDKRGSGASDRSVGALTLDHQMDDVAAVMDAAGSDDAVLFGYFDGGVVASTFAATHPERTRGLVLYATPPRFVPGPGYPWGIPAEFVESELEGSGGLSMQGVLSLLAPSRAGDATFQHEIERMARASTSPGGFAEQVRAMAATDIRHVMSAIEVPTLMLTRRDDPLFPPDWIDYMRRLMPRAHFGHLRGSDTILWVDEFDPLIDEIEEFVTGFRPVAEPHRTLATLLMTDIVTSTDQLAAAGDRKWGATLDRHDALLRRLFQRYSGREVKTTGDGFLATFDRPTLALECATAITAGAASLGLAVRVGLHTGECDLRAGDLGGLAVHIAARVTAAAAPGEVLVSSTVRDLVAGSGFEFDDRGEHTLKGVPGAWRLLAVRSAGVPS